jgi:hypothetical protein
LAKGHSRGRAGKGSFREENDLSRRHLLANVDYATASGSIELVLG